MAVACIIVSLVHTMSRHPSTVTSRSPFPAEFTGYIIGRQGNGIRSLEQTTGARLRVDTQRYNHYNGEWCYLQATGTEQQVDAARVQLMMRVRDAIHAAASPAQSRAASP